MATTSRELLPILLSTLQSTRTHQNQDQTVTPSTIRQDLSTLLSLLSKESTNLSLALKPPPDERATLQTLQQVKGLVEKLKYLQSLINSTTTSSSSPELVKRMRWSLIQTFESLSQFLTTSQPYLPPLSSSTSTSSNDAKTSRQRLLQSAKQFWTMIDRETKMLPENELQAVRTCWKEVVGLLSDCETELVEMTKTLDQDEEDEEEDGEEEVKQDLTESQLDLVTPCRNLLKLSRLLINRIYSLTDSTPPSSSSTTTTSSITKRFEQDETLLSDLTTRIKRLSELADDLAGAIEDYDEEEDGDEEDEEGELIQVVKEIGSIGEEVSTMFEQAYREIVTSIVQGQGLKDENEDEVEERGQGKGEEELKKVMDWFEMWRKQRDDAKSKVLDVLRREEVAE